jgi:CheY-like chemotaxis protein/HPt (histidine-containing phosphotransfer) domain-containing protein
VDSEQGKGSEFRFTLCLKKGEETVREQTAEQAEAKPALQPGRLGGKVLVVEDNMINQEVARGILERMGLTVEVAGDGGEALRLLQAHNYDLVFMDVHMPEMDGFEATGNFRAADGMATPQDVPIVAMTANAMQGDRERCLQAGMTDYVAKPIRSKPLKALLAKYLTPQPTDDDRPRPQTKEPKAPLVINPEMALSAVGDAQFRERIEGALLREARQRIPLLLQHIESAEWTQVREHAHGLRGALANLGAEAICMVLGEIEAAVTKVPLPESGLQQLGARLAVEQKRLQDHFADAIEEPSEDTVK